MTSTKPSTSCERYLRCSLHTSGAALAPLPRHPHAAPTKPPRSHNATPNAAHTAAPRSHAAPTPLSLRPSAAATPSQRCCKAAPTPPPNRRNAALSLLHAALKPLCAALTLPSPRYTPPSRRSTRLRTVPTPSEPPGPPPLRCCHRLTYRPCAAATQPQRRPRAALTPLHAILTDGAAGRVGVGEKAHDSEKNAKMVEKINTIMEGLLQRIGRADSLQSI